MKALTYKIAVLCLSALTTVSCSDFLQEDPKGQMTNLESFTEKSDLEGSIHALYYQVKMASGYIGIYAPVLMGDDMTSIISKSNFTDWDQFVSNDGNSMMTSGVGCWSCMWNVVKAANYIINGVEKTPGATADDINFAIAEARFWRAYAYFWMVRCWGPLPIIESFQLNVDATARSEEQVYDFLVKDLKFAETYLPTEYTTEPWNINGMNTIATRAAAQAALAQVYLTMAGWPLNKGTEYYKLAADKAKEVIDQVETVRTSTSCSTSSGKYIRASTTRPMRKLSCRFISPKISVWAMLRRLHADWRSFRKKPADSATCVRRSSSGKNFRQDHARRLSSAMYIITIRTRKWCLGSTTT